MEIGLTGLIGSGKTTAANILADFGGHIINADILTNEILSKNIPFLDKLRAIFPENIFQNEGVNKKEIARIIFNDKHIKNEYEKLIHPEIDKLYKQELKGCKERYGENCVIIYDAPLLFEVGYTLKDFSHIILITASKENCIKRIIERNKCSQEEAIVRFNSQIPPEKKKLMADIIIENDTSLEELRKKLNQFWIKLNNYINPIN